MPDGKPAARLGDDTAHGGVVKEGAETVLIGGQPAARISDDHECGKSRHRGGPIVTTGNPTVLVEGKPLARVTDKAVCRGCDDTISKGETTVLIGQEATTAPISERGKAVMDKYIKKMEAQLDVSAKDLAKGTYKKTVTQDFALAWTKDLLMELPLGDTAIGRGLGDLLGLKEEELKLTPKELGKKRGKDVEARVKREVEKFRRNHVVLFWSAASLAAIGAGVLTYSEGTAILEKVGVQPKVSETFFGDKLKLDGAFSMGKKLSDPNFKLGAEEKLGSKVRLWQKAEIGGKDFSSLDLKSAQLGAEETLGKVKLTQKADFGADGVKTVDLGASEDFGNLKMWQKAQLGGNDLGLDKYSLGADYKVPLSDPKNSLNIGGSYARDNVLDTDQFTGYVKGQQDGWTYGANGLLNPEDGYKVQGHFGKKFSESGVIEGYVEHSDIGGVRDTAAGFQLKWSF